MKLSVKFKTRKQLFHLAHIDGCALAIIWRRQGRTAHIHLHQLTVISNANFITSRLTVTGLNSIRNDAEEHQGSSLESSNHNLSHDYLQGDAHSSMPGHPPASQDLDSPMARRFYNIPSSMDSEEASYLIRTILSFKYYQRQSFEMNHIRMQNFYALPESQRALLQPQFTAKLEAIDSAIEKNALLAKQIATLGEEMYLEGREVKMDGPLRPRHKCLFKLDRD